MKKVNLRDLYPDVYKTDHFVEVTEDVRTPLCKISSTGEIEQRFRLN